MLKNNIQDANDIPVARHRAIPSIMRNVYGIATAMAGKTMPHVFADRNMPGRKSKPDETGFGRGAGALGSILPGFQRQQPSAGLGGLRHMDVALPGVFIGQSKATADGQAGMHAGNGP